MKHDYSIVIIGAGVIGLAIAKSLKDKGIDSVLIIEKENRIGQGTSSRNSEVIHSGIYYPKESLKAHLCTQGRDQLYTYCESNNIWFSKCGKLVIAQKGQEAQLNSLYQNAISNGVPDLKMISKSQIKEIEPHVSADSALFVGCTGIIDSHGLMQSLKDESENGGHDYLFNYEVTEAKQHNDGFEIRVQNSKGELDTVTTDWVINAGGLSSDIIAHFLPHIPTGTLPKLQFSKGEYFKLSSKWRNQFTHLVYPLPDTSHDSLGIHLSFDALGNSKLGPSAHWIKRNEMQFHVDETYKSQFFTEGKSYLPDLDINDLTPDFSGIRPKIKTHHIHFHDFYIQHEIANATPGWINLIGIDSPGLTSSLTIGNMVSEMVVV